MYHKHHTKGIVLLSKNEGLDSKRLYILTESFGLVNARVQGARELRSKLRVGVQDFCMSEFSLVSGKNGWKVVGVKPEKNIFEIFRSSPEKLKVSMSVLSLVRKLVGEEVYPKDSVGRTDPSLFSIVANFLKFLVETKDSNTPLAECLVLLKILHSLGYMRSDPDLSLPISSLEIENKDLDLIAPRRSHIIKLINESLRATHLI